MSKKEPDYFDHLEELRLKIISILVVLAVLTIVSFFFMEKIMVFLKTPLNNVNVELNYFKPQEKLTSYIKGAFFCGILLVIPFAVYQISNFIAPALEKSERFFFKISLICAVTLFYIGGGVSFIVLAPAVYNFFINFAPSDGVIPLWSIKEYFDLLFTMILILGITFNTPIILSLLIKFNIITTRTLIGFRKHIIVVIFILAAVITPTVDVVTQIIVSVIMYLSFEFTIIFGKIIERRADKRLKSFLDGAEDA